MVGVVVVAGVALWAVGHRIVLSTSATIPPTLKGLMMARTKANQGDNGEETTSAYFRRILKENPKLLKKGTNKELFDRWLKDHPGNEEVPDNIKYILSNVKAVVRKKRRQRRSETAQAALSNSGSSSSPNTTKRVGRILEQLEERIDDCLAIARNADREGLAHVIELLRTARNEVVRLVGM